MKNWEKLCVCTLMLLAVLILLPNVRAEAAAVASGNWSNLNWTLDDEGLLTISGSGTMPGFDLEPAGGWRAYADSIRRVVIEQDVTSIGMQAFRDCENLADITIPASVTAIDPTAFIRCGNLADFAVSNDSSSYYAWNGILYDKDVKTIISFPGGKTGSRSLAGSTTAIGRAAFYGCSGLTSLILPGTVTSISADAFVSCDALTDLYFKGTQAQWDAVSIGDNNPSLDASAIHCVLDCGSWRKLSWVLDNDGLLTITGQGSMDDFANSFGHEATKEAWRQYETDIRRVVIEDGIANVSNHAFYDCVNLTEAVIPDSVTIFADYAFYNCTRLRSVSVPSGLTRIGKYAFKDCTALPAISFPASLTTIDVYAFSGCGGLKKLVVPASVTSIDYRAFDGCSGLNSAGPIGSGYDYQFGWTETIPNNAFGGCSGLSYVNLPESITRIGVDAFSGCSSLSGIILPQSLTELGGRSLSDSGLRQITIPSGVRWINSDTFSGCTSLSSITISEGVSYIADQAFYGCTALKSIALPTTVSSLGERVFKNCTSLTSISIPENVTRIKIGAFAGCTALTDIAFPNHLDSIENAAFDGCTRLTEIYLPGTLTYIGPNAFNGCTGLSTVHFSGAENEWKTKVSNYDGSDALTNATLICSLLARDKWGDNISWQIDYDGRLTISGNGQMKALSYSYYQSQAWHPYDEQITELRIEEGVTGISAYAFQNSSNLKSAVIPAGIQSVSSYAFYGCRSLQSISLPEGMTEISASAFYGCSQLRSVELPSTLTYIGNSAFCNCGLQSVEIPEGVTVLKSSCFSQTYLSTIRIPLSVTKIESGAFSRNLRVEYAGTRAQWEAINNEDSNIAASIVHSEVDHIDFLKGEQFSWTKTDDGVLTLSGEGEFTGWVASGDISELILEQGITEIDEMYIDFDNLTKITFPLSMTHIHSFCFEHCPKLSDVYYDGSQSQWNDVLKSDNSALESTAIHFHFSRYTIAYDANGGSAAPEAQTELKDTALTLSDTAPTRPDSSAEGYTVTLDPNGGSGSPTTLTAARTVSYSFQSWNTNVDGSGTDYAPGGSITSDEDMTLYAQWRTGYATESVSLPAPVRTGFSFQGWALSSDAASGTTDSYTPDGDVTLYAAWKRNEYTVTFDANGGTGAPESQTKLYGISLNLSDEKPTHADNVFGGFTVSLDANGGSVSPTSLTAARTTGYSFRNWNTNADGSGLSYSPGAAFTTNANVTLYAQWDTSVSTASIDLPTPSRSGFSFQGWSGDADADTGITGSYTPDESETLFAVWKRRTYTVTYNANGGTDAPESQTKIHGTALSLSDAKPVRADYSVGSYTVNFDANGGVVDPAVLTAARTVHSSFLNWNTRADGSGADFAPGAALTTNANITLYAQWESSVTTESIMLPIPQREDHVFLGWALSSDAASGTTGSYSPKSSMTLYAVWASESRFDVTRDAYRFGNTMSSYGYTGRGPGASYPIKYDPSFKLIFGDTVAAKSKYKQAIMTLWGGNCCGMSSTIALMNAGQLSPTAFGRSEVQSLGIRDTNGSMSVLTFIEAMQVAQYTDHFAKAYKDNRVYNYELAAGSGKLTALYNAVNDDLAHGHGTIIGVCRTGIGAHALFAYRMESVSDTEKKMFIYDCNFPAETRYFTLRFNSEGRAENWTYDMGDYGTWGTESSDFISFIPFDTIDFIWTHRGRLYEDKEMLSFTGENLSITDFSGQEVAAIVGGQLQTSREDIYALPELSMSWNSTRSVFLPKDFYTVTSSDGSDLELSMVDNNIGANVTTSASAVSFSVDESTRENTVIVENATQNDSYTVSLESSLAGVRYENVVVRGTGRNESISISGDNDNLSISNCNVDSLQINGVERITYTIRAYSGEGGTISPKGDVLVNVNGSCLFNIKPDTGYVIDNVKIDGIDMGAVSSYEFQNVVVDHTIAAYFKRAYGVNDAFFDRSTAMVTAGLINQSDVRMVCAVYSEEGQMLCAAAKSLPGNCGTASIALPEVELPPQATFKVFLLDSRWKPLCMSYIFIE